MKGKEDWIYSSLFCNDRLKRGKKSFGHVKIDAKRVSDSGVLCTVVDLHKREELGVRAVTETCSSRLQARDEEMTNCYLKFFDMINKIYTIIITSLRK